MRFRLPTMLLAAAVVACGDGDDVTAPEVRDLTGIWYFTWTAVAPETAPQPGLVCTRTQVRVKFPYDGTAPNDGDGSYQGGTEQCVLDEAVVSEGPIDETGEVFVEAFDDESGAVSLAFDLARTRVFAGGMDVNGTTMEGELEGGTWSAVKAVD